VSQALFRTGAAMPFRLIVEPSETLRGGREDANISAQKVLK